MLLSVRAFNIETAKLKSSVTDESTRRAALGRLEFWRGAVDTLDKEHPVVVALKESKTNPYWLRQVITARVLASRLALMGRRKRT